MLRPGGMYNGVHRSGIVYTDSRSMNSTFLERSGFCLSIGVRHVCVNCVSAEEWAWETELQFDGGATVRICRKLKDSS